MDCSYQILIRMIDDFLAALGTSGIVDGQKVRDQLLDLRTACTALETEALSKVII